MLWKFYIENWIFYILISSSLLYQGSSIQHQVTSIKYPVSNIKLSHKTFYSQQFYKNRISFWFLHLPTVVFS